MSYLQELFIFAAGFGAGAINAVAGGGSLISFPALLAVGLPPITANVTNSIAVWPGYVGSVLAYRSKIAEQKKRTRDYSLISIVGAILGTIILLTAPPTIFKILVPYLIFAATTLLLVQTQMLKLFTRVGTRNPTFARFIFAGGLFVASIYGSYFGAGLGIILLAILASFIQEDLQLLNGIKMFLSLVIASVGFVIYAIYARVDWSSVAIMALATLMGGYLGAGVARRLSQKALKISVVCFGYIIGAILLFKG